MSKPKNKRRIVDLCIEFDELFPKPKDEAMHTRLYTDLYYIYYSLSKNKNYFRDYQDYQEFANYAASVIYTRFLRKQERGEEINSVLNYAKFTLPKLKVAYQNENFHEVLNDTVKLEKNALGLIEFNKELIQKDYSKNLKEDICILFEDLPMCIKQVVLETPYKNNELLCNNIYLSCLLTIVSQITIPESIRTKIQKKEQKGSTNADNLLIRILSKASESKVILWHLSQDYTDLIHLLVNKSKITFGKKINDTKTTYNLDDSLLDAIMLASYSTAADKEA